MKKLNFLQAVLFNAFVGIVIAFIFSFNPFVFAIAVNCIGITMAKVKQATGMVFFDGLAQEVWLADVLQDFYPSNHFLSAARDLSSLCDNEAINLAEVGADPDVLVNNTVWPIPYTVAADSPLKILLKTYDTTSSVVRNAVAIEQAYDQRAIYVQKHQRALLKKLGMDAAWAYGVATADSTKSNTITELNANDSFIDAVIDKQTEYADMDADTEDWIAIYTPAHMAMIAKEDKKLYKAIMAKPGDVFYGFKTYTYSKNPYYITAANAPGGVATKAGYGAAFNPAVHKKSSLFCLGSEIMVAQGGFEFFSRMKDPDYKGDIFNYQMRGVAAPLRNKHLGAIIA
ncbi:hypothetical protein [Pinibacter soli]|uniref:Major capsid protein n=1 Tax=Pinibacter soli TaxID=3044211 RepID=A0ABT6R994_9BACT|nr:hypothetical protein [Pinibacter soli]MDI3319134.1 hypothetical protein [Pinibacter soli]